MHPVGSKAKNGDSSGLNWIVKVEQNPTVC